MFYTHRVVWVSCLYLQLSQYPDAIGELHRLVQHVLPIHCALGYGEDVAALQFVGGCIYEGNRIKNSHNTLYISVV